MWSWNDVDEAYLERIVNDGLHHLHDPAIAGIASRLEANGSLYLHCDHNASHYLKILLDRIFGKDNFKNDLIWRYGGSARGAKAIAKHFARNNDNIFFYTKDKTKYSHNPIYINKEYPIDDLPSHIRLGSDGKYFKTAPRGDYTDESIAKLRKEGRVYETRSGNIRIKYFLKKEGAKVLEPTIVGSVWDIPDMMHSPQAERLNYPTQKPLALLRRIIEASSNEGNVVLDPFCGCATTMVAAQQLQRRWIGIDIEEKAADLVVQRLSDDADLFKDFIHRVDIPVRDDVNLIDITNYKNKKEVKKKLAKENGASCNACGMENYENLEIDHVLPKSKGGQDTYNNYQLLCGNCNRIKSNHPMEYLMGKIAEREKLLKKQITFGRKAA